MNITKINKQTKKNKKADSTATRKHKTDMIIAKINKYKKLSNTSTTVHKTEHNYILVNQTIKQ